MGLEPTKRNKKMMKAYEDLETRILPSNIFYCTNFRISALASKMGQIKKIKAFYYIKWYIITNLHDNVPLSFLFDPF